MIYISNILLGLSFIFIALGLVGIARFDSVYSRLLTSSKIDTAAVILILVALIIRTGFSPTSLKIFTILTFVLLTSPVSNHLIASSAYHNAIAVEEDENDA